MAKQRYYKLDDILKYNADYNVIYGGRSNGKTTAVLRYALEHHIESGYKSQLAIVRRWEEDFKGKNGQQMYESFVYNGWIVDLTKGKYNAVYYYSQRWYLCYFDKNGEKISQQETPFAMGFSISSEEHYKSTSYPNVEYILFDEFITRQYYLPEEFVRFQNLLSTIIRLKDNVKIFMCGNTINKFCPYFAEMGLTNVFKQQQGTIDLYTYGDSNLRVAVEYTDSFAKKKEVNKYFAFNNPKLQMITNGGWELDIYPHLPRRYTPKDIIYTYYIEFDKHILECEIITVDDVSFTFIHRKTTPIKDDNTRLVYTTNIRVERNYSRNLLRPVSVQQQQIYNFFKREKVFYQDNDVGEIVNNYLKWCEDN